MPIAEMLLPLVPGGALIEPFVPQLVKAINAIEQKPGVSGPEKRAYVQEVVAQSAAVANDARPGSVDVPVVVEAAGHYVDAIIGTVNAVQKAKAALPDVPPILAPVLPPSA
jgi:hypothetical protein